MNKHIGSMAARLACGVLGWLVAGCAPGVTIEQGCDPETETCEETPDPTGLEVGGASQTMSFIVLTPSAKVPLVAGGQGGYHLWVSIRCTACSGLAEVSFRVEDADSGQPLTNGTLSQYLTFSADHPESSYLYGFLQTMDKGAVDGHHVRFIATAQSAKGEALSAEGEATVEGLEYDEQPL